MPELRSGARRGRAQANPVVQAEQPKTRRRRTARNQQPVGENPPAEEIGQVEGRGEVGGLAGEEIQEGVGERKMNDYHSGAKSADKLAGAEDEGNAAPLPEKVRPLPDFFSDL